VASESYRLCMQCHPVARHDILPCFLKRHCVLFFIVWCVTTYGCWIVADDCFFFFSSSLPDKVYDCPLYFYFFNFSPYYFNLLFGLYSFYKSLFVFNLVLYNFSCVFFFILVLVLLIFNLFHLTSCLSFIGLQFHHSIKVHYFCFFYSSPHSLDFSFRSCSFYKMFYLISI
jgi:hypothetical protein